MKRSLVALAAMTVLAGAASAQSSVTLSGIFKSGVASTKYSNGATGNGSGLSVADGSSRIIISGVEDLGGGVAAIFQNDTRFRIDDNGGGAAFPASGPTTTASQLAGGNTFIGLRGGFGTFRIGKLDTHYCLGSDTHGTRATALQASSCALLGFVNGAGAAQSIANASRTMNLIRYDMPSIAGFSGGVGYSTSWANPGSEGAVNADDGKALNVNFGYAIGPVSLAASRWSAVNEAKTSDERGVTGHVNVNLGFMTVGATYDRSSKKPNPGGRTERNVWSVPVTVRLGAGTLVATYSKAEDAEFNGVKLANTGATLYSVGYEHSLSKRTSLGVSYANLNNKAAAGYGLYTQVALAGHAGPVAGQDQRQLYFGLRHTF